jgi:hypothetical protein
MTHHSPTPYDVPLFEMPGTLFGIDTIKQTPLDQLTLPREAPHRGTLDGFGLPTMSDARAALDYTEPGPCSSCGSFRRSVPEGTPCPHCPTTKETK